MRVAESRDIVENDSSTWSYRIGFGEIDFRLLGRDGRSAGQFDIAFHVHVYRCRRTGRRDALCFPGCSLDPGGSRAELAGRNHGRRSQPFDFDGADDRSGGQFIPI